LRKMGSRRSVRNLHYTEDRVITADDRLDKLADDFVEYCAARWESGKSMLVCIDKITCARMCQRIEPRWQAKIARIEAQIPVEEAALAAAADADERGRIAKRLEWLRGQARWMRETIIEIVISEAQNEVRDFSKWGFDIIPHRVVMKNGFETPDGKRVNMPNGTTISKRSTRSWKSSATRRT
jgi:type I restriction enzyme, R subunit